MVDQTQSPDLSYVEFHIHDGESPGAFEEYGYVYNLTLPSVEYGERDDTHLKSTVVTYGRNLPDPGTFEVTLPYVEGSTAQTELRALLISGEARDCKFVYGPDTGDANEIISARLIAINRSAPVNDKATQVIRFRVLELGTFGTES